jgi:hypothetical protein
MEFTVNYRLALVTWITSAPVPFFSDVTAIPYLPFLEPQWAVRTMAGLYLTSNPTPSVGAGVDTTALQSSLQYRSIQSLNIAVTYRAVCGPATEGGPEFVYFVLSTALSRVFQSPGYTAPFQAALESLLPSGIIDYAITKFLSGQKSAISAIDYAWHPNSSIKGNVADDLSIVSNGVLKYRAGSIVDKIGVGGLVGSPCHVPWVWSEFAVLIKPGPSAMPEPPHVFWRATKFPSAAIYFGQVAGGDGIAAMQTQLADDHFSGLDLTTKTFDFPSMKIYPALTVGVPATLPQPPANADRSAGPIDTHANTVEAGKIFALA